MGTFRGGSDHEPMLSVEEAQERVLELVTPFGIEQIALQNALHRVLAEDVIAPFDVPEGDNSAMDGYALIADDTPGTLRVIEDIPAGAAPRERVEHGTASRIMTGALVPEGADAIAQVEITDGGSEAVRIERKVVAGTHVRRRGEDMRAGDIVIARGMQIGPAEIGVLATVQQSNVSVARKPVIAILATGNEILDLDAPRRAGAIVNSNSYALAALAREAGAEPRLRGIIADTREATVEALSASLDCDFIVTSGGVSAGAYDFVKDAVAELGADTRVWRVAMKPGKPVVVSRLPGGQVAFGLPGNPVSCMVAFILFVAPAIRKALGQAQLFPPVVDVRVDAPLRAPGDRRTYLRVRVIVRDGELVAVPMKAQGSHVSTSMLGANGLAIVEGGVTRIEAGELAPVLLIGNTFNGM
ncbi:MAG TPA: gephyrin-like molybdotransferase Glp [Thermoanaerobaculia bacterium]|nr:gephyrin-like molybdotransferase Glp [Thermoanaerobaculia bacterium]